MINYLKQYADKTYEELVNSLIWFDLSLKLKAIFAKIPTTFKTINDESIVGEGNIEITSGGGETLQDLQSVLSKGGYAEIEAQTSALNIFGGQEGNRQFSFYANTVDNLNSGEIYINPEASSIGTYVLEPETQNVIIQAYLKSTSGVAEISQGSNLSGGIKTSTLKLSLPISNSNYFIPAKSIAGNYTINTTPNSVYTVSTLPTGVLNDMAIVSDAAAPTYLGVLVGGGSVVTPVWYNGTSWVSR